MTEIFRKLHIAHVWLIRSWREYCFVYFQQVICSQARMQGNQTDIETYIYYIISSYLQWLEMEKMTHSRGLRYSWLNWMQNESSNRRNLSRVLIKFWFGLESLDDSIIQRYCWLIINNIIILMKLNWHSIIRSPWLVDATRILAIYLHLC